jgi:hypothetical protein
MSGTIGLLAFMVVMGAVGLLWPRALTTIWPFGKFLIYQRIAKSRPLMLLNRFGGGVMLVLGALLLWQALNGRPG